MQLHRAARVSRYVAIAVALVCDFAPFAMTAPVKPSTSSSTPLSRETISRAAICIELFCQKFGSPSSRRSCISSVRALVEQPNLPELTMTIAVISAHRRLTRARCCGAHFTHSSYTLTGHDRPLRPGRAPNFLARCRSRRLSTPSHPRPPSSVKATAVRTGCQREPRGRQYPTQRIFKCTPRCMTLRAMAL